MTRLTDRIEQIEFDLARYPGSDAPGLLNRRLILRKHLTAWGDERYGDGHHDGVRDARDTQIEAERRASEAGGETEQD